MTQLTEYLSKSILERFGVPIGPRHLVETEDEVSAAIDQLGLPVMVKAQVPVGGRGKAGAIQRADSIDAALRAFHQVRSINFGSLQALQALVEPVVDLERELYLSIVIDAEYRGPVILFGAGGGVEIEADGRVTRIPLRPDNSVPSAALRRALYDASLSPRLAERVVLLAQALARALVACDAQLVELNPVAVLPDETAVALDARVVVDDYALHRQPEIAQLIRNMRPRYPEDLVRDRTRLEYVKLDGWLGLISGGAGMTMVVMDLISEFGGEPACFLDCSANPTRDGYGAALKLLMDDPRVSAILISIFGGLTQMDRVAKNLADLLTTDPINKPVTLRLMGTNIDAAEKILEGVGLTNHRQLENAVSAAVASRVVQPVGTEAVG